MNFAIMWMCFCCYLFFSQVPKGRNLPTPNDTVRTSRDRMPICCLSYGLLGVMSTCGDDVKVYFNPNRWFGTDSARCQRQKTSMSLKWIAHRGGVPRGVPAPQP